MKIYSFLGLFLLLLSGPVQAYKFVNENLLTSDSDDAEQQRHLLGVKHEVPQLGGMGGFWFGQWQFDETIGSEDFNMIRLSYEHSFNELTSLDTKIEFLSGGDDWSPELAALTLVHDPANAWRFEASYERGIIDSVGAIRQELTHDTFSVAADWNFAEQWTAVGALLNMDIDDGNTRQGGVFRLIYSVPQIEALTLQTRSKVINSDFDGIGYFSPDKLEEHLLLVGYGRPIFGNKFSVYGLLGAGTQDFTLASGDTIDNDLYYLELRARGWFNDRYGIESTGYCSNTGGPNDGAPDNDYRYCSLLFSVLAVF